jgi:hypothetical protein
MPVMAREHSSGRRIPRFAKRVQALRRVLPALPRSVLPLRTGDFPEGRTVLHSIVSSLAQTTKLQEDNVIGLFQALFAGSASQVHAQVFSATL